MSTLDYIPLNSSQRNIDKNTLSISLESPHHHKHPAHFIRTHLPTHPPLTASPPPPHGTPGWLVHPPQIPHRNHLRPQRQENNGHGPQLGCQCVYQFLILGRHPAAWVGGTTPCCVYQHCGPAPGCVKIPVPTAEWGGEGLGGAW